MNLLEHFILIHQGMEYFQQISINSERKETIEMVHQLLPLQDYRLKLIMD